MTETSLASDVEPSPEQACNLIKQSMAVFGEAPLYQRMGRALDDLIESRSFRPGQMLPSERLMMRELRVSRRTIRAAIDGLIARKRLVSVHGKGHFIRKDRSSTLDIIVPEPFLPDHWGKRPDHYHWIRTAAQSERCTEKYQFTPDLAELDRLLLRAGDHREGVLVFRPNSEWLARLNQLQRSKRVENLRPVVVVNRPMKGTRVHSASDDHVGATARSVALLAGKTSGPLGLVTMRFPELPFAIQQKQGFDHAIQSFDLPVGNHLEISFADIQSHQAPRMIAEFIERCRLGGIIIAGSAFEDAFLNARQGEFSELPSVIFTERREGVVRPPEAICYFEPTMKVIEESFAILRDVLEEGTEEIQNRLVLGEFSESRARASGAPIPA